MLPRKTQHKKNAQTEARYITDAKNDYRYEMQQRSIDLLHGNRVMAAFHKDEANKSLSWVNKRQRLLARERRLSK